MNENPVLVTKAITFGVSLLVAWLAQMLPFIQGDMAEGLTWVLTLAVGGLVGNLIARAKVTPWWKVAEGYWTRERVAKANTPTRLYRDPFG